MFRFGLAALLVGVITMLFVVQALADEHIGGKSSVYLEIMRKPPNRHVITMKSMEECMRAAQYSNARCISDLPRLPDESIGVFRSATWSARPFFNDTEHVLEGKDFGPAYLVVRSSPPNRHVIAMVSMKKCLEAIAYTSAECIEKLPALPDSSIGVFRTINGSDF